MRESQKVFCVKTTQTLYLKVLCGRKLKMQKKYDFLSTVDLEKERMKESIKKASHSRLKSNNIVQYREVRPDCFWMPLRYFVHLYNIVYTVYYPLIHCSIVLILAQCATWGSSLLTTWLVSNAWDESLVRKMTSYSFGPFPDDFGNSKFLSYTWFTTAAAEIDEFTSVAMEVQMIWRIIDIAVFF